MNLKQKFQKKLKKSGGFTLIEMLIVVAIIAILVAISIPMVNSSLEKARVATDAANERSAKAAAMITYMDGIADIPSGGVLYYYDAIDGLVYPGEMPTSEKGYGQCASHKGGYLKVTIMQDGAVKLAWSKGSGLHSEGTAPAG